MNYQVKKVTESLQGLVLTTPAISLFAFLLFSFGFFSCTKDVVIEVPPQAEQIVVEGYIETGLPPYVLLTRSSDFYSTFYLDSINDFFLRDALVRVSDGTDTITLQELQIDTGGVLVSAYVGLGMVGQEGKTYSLFIEVEETTVTAVTSIPQASPLDSVWWEPVSSPDDTLVRLICLYSDPPAQGNHVRYFTKVNSQPFYPGLNSVFDDALVNGQTFSFPLDRGVNRNDSAAFDDYGLFKRGDTVIVRWSGIDKASYDFWRTIEFELGSQGSPFASPVVIQSNVSGGLGIWCGYAPTYQSLMIPK